LLGASYVLRLARQGSPGASLPSAACHQLSYAAGFSGFLNGEHSQDLSPGEEIHRCLRLWVLSLATFLIAALFLSRAYTLTLYVILGFMQSLTLLAVQEQGVPLPHQFLRSLRYTFITGVVIISVLYCVLRLHLA
jgi:hypothetical protein